MQRGYRGVLTEPTGERFDPCFVPDLIARVSRLKDCKAGRAATASATASAAMRKPDVTLWWVGCVGISLQCNSHERKITVNGLGTRGSVGVDALGRLDRYRDEFVGFVVKPINHAILTVEVAP
jgi:hypothetical protein